LHSVLCQPKAIPVLYDTKIELTIIEKHYTVGVQTSNETEILPNNSIAFALFSLSGKPYNLREKRTEQFSPQPFAEPLFVFINI
jgi:hypothetical protein